MIILLSPQLPCSRNPVGLEQGICDHSHIRGIWYSKETLIP